ncbi:hypothetical protein STVA_20480 [Allostella vacuolata]|nr:hypothetical protein STVA_20480 [Stella vacuolata]
MLMAKDAQRARAPRAPEGFRGGFAPPADVAGSPYRLGTVVRLHRGEALPEVFSRGWCDIDEGGFVWIDGAVGELSFDLPVLLRDLVLELDCFPVGLVGAEPQRMGIFVDGSFVDALMMRERAVVRIPIARELCPGKRMRISIVPGVVQVPKLATDSSDERALSIGVHAVALGYEGD